MDRPIDAILDLMDNQIQLDRDGINVGVSRQALKDVLQYVHESYVPSIEFVRHWHKTFDVPINEDPRRISKKRADLRVELLKEELKELEEAIEAEDLVAILDGLTDLQYILDGTYLEFGFHSVKALAFIEVQRSNMSKLGHDGSPILREDGKVLKGPNYSPPDLKTIVVRLFAKIDEAKDG